MRASSADHATIALARWPLQLADGSFSNSHRPSSEGTFRVDAPECTPIYAVDRGLGVPLISLNALTGHRPAPRRCTGPSTMPVQDAAPVSGVFPADVSLRRLGIGIQAV